MNPLRLRLANYRCFDHLDLDLPTGCVAVLGENGAGKSSIVSAIDLAIFGPESRSLADYHADTAAPDDDLLIELEFEHASETYKVRRTFSPRGRGKTVLDFERWKDAPEHTGDDTGPEWTPLTCESAKATQELIEQTIGLSRETFRASAFLAQGDGAAFSEAQPRDRKRILAEVLGLDRWNVLRDRNRVELRQLERQLNETAGRVGAARDLAAGKADVLVAHANAHAGELDHADTLADREREHQELGQRWQQARERAARRQAAEAELAAARDQLDRLQRLDVAATEAALAHTVTKDELETLATPAQLAEIEQELEQLHAAEAEWRRLVADREAIVARAQDARRSRDELLVRANELLAKKTDAAAKADALETAEQPTCQTCGQTVDGEARARAIDAYRTAAAAFEQDASELADQVVAIDLPEIPAEISAPTVGGVHIEEAKLAASRAAAQRRVDQQQRARLEERLVALQVTVDARPAQPQLAEAVRVCDEKLHALDALEDAVDIAQLEQQGLAAKRAVDAAKVAFDAARTQRTRLEERLAQITVAEEQIAAAEQDGAKVAREIEVVAQLDRAFSPDGIPALIVENSAIPYLETEASRILADLGTSFRVELRTQAALKSGDGVRDTLDVVIQTQESERPYETFSGGERTRLNLALRIALARLLAHRRGAESRLLCIDEPEFLDEQGTAALVDVLRGLQDDFERVYLISHVPALRDSFDEVLTVVKGDDGVSRVDEQAVFETVPA